jgi:hypothetical protein
MDELRSRRHLDRTWKQRRDRKTHVRPPANQRFAGSRVPAQRNPARLRASTKSPAPHMDAGFSLSGRAGAQAHRAGPGRAFFLHHGFDVAAMQRCRRLEAVEQDANGAAITTRADDNRFPAGEIWASHRSERTRPDTGPCRQRRLLIGWLFAGSGSGTTRFRGIHLSRPTPRSNVRGPADPVCSASRATSSPTVRSPVRLRPTARH